MSDLGHVFKMLDKKGKFIKVDFHKEIPKDVDKYTNLGGWTYHEVFEKKDYETEKSFIREGDIVVDIGANLGFFTVYAALKGASEIYSFEPDIKNFECLKSNAPANAKLFNNGIMAEAGEHDFFVDIHPGGHSFFNMGDTRTGEKRTIQCLSIPRLFEEKLLSRIDFLKIDTEGAEFEIFEYLPGRYFQKIRNIAMETHEFMFPRSRFVALMKRLGEWYNWTQKTNGSLSVFNMWRRNAAAE